MARSTQSRLIKTINPVLTDFVGCALSHEEIGFLKISKKTQYNTSVSRPSKLLVSQDTKKEPTGAQNIGSVLVFSALAGTAPGGGATADGWLTFR